MSDLTLLKSSEDSASTITGAQAAESTLTTPYNATIRRLRSSLPPVQPPHIDQNYGSGGAFGFVFASVSACTATLFSNPLDVAKVRLQMQKGPGKGKYSGTFDCLKQTWKTEGVRGTQAGLSAALLKEGTKNFFRLGLYEPVLRCIQVDKTKKAGVKERMLAGAFSGGFSSLLCNPLDLVKTRVQANALKEIAVVDGGTQSKKNLAIKPLAVARKMIAEEAGGVRSLWKGTNVNILRSIVANSVVLTTNFALKDMLKENKDNVFGLSGEGWVSDTVCSMIAASVTITIMNPIDVVRTRLYNQSNCSKGFTQTAKDMLLHEGPGAFYKGCVSHFLRFGPHTMLTLVFIGVCQRNARKLKEYWETKEWEKQMRAGFLDFDIDKSGALEMDEVRSALLSILRVTPRGLMGDEIIDIATKKIMAEVSGSNKGVVSEDEFVNLCYALDREAREIEIDALFKRVDTDGTGHILKRDIISAVGTLTRRSLVHMGEEYTEQLQVYLDQYKQKTSDISEHHVILDRKQFGEMCVDIPKLVPEAVAMKYFQELGVTL